MSLNKRLLEKAVEKTVRDRDAATATTATGTSLLANQTQSRAGRIITKTNRFADRESTNPNPSNVSAKVAMRASGVVDLSGDNGVIATDDIANGVIATDDIEDSSDEESRGLSANKRAKPNTRSPTLKTQRAAAGSVLARSPMPKTPQSAGGSVFPGVPAFVSADANPNTRSPPLQTQRAAAGSVYLGFRPSFQPTQTPSRPRLSPDQRLPQPGLAPRQRYHHRWPRVRRSLRSRPLKTKLHPTPERLVRGWWSLRRPIRWCCHQIPIAALAVRRSLLRTDN